MSVLMDWKNELSLTQTPNLRTCRLVCIGTSLQRREEKKEERKGKYCISAFYYLRQKETLLLSALVFLSLIDRGLPAGLISLGIRMFTLHKTPFRTARLCLLAC